MNRTLLNGQNGKPVITFAERPGVDFQISKKEIGRGASCIVYHAVGSDSTEHLLKEYYPKHLELVRDSSGHIVVPEDRKEFFEQGLVRFRAGCERQKSIRLSNEGLKNFTCNVQGYYAANSTEYIDMTCFNGQTYDHVQEQSVYNLMLRMRTLAQVVGNYHKAGLLHLDIKPENIYVRPESETIEDVMLFDFDSVTPMSEITVSKALSCTKTWAAPEQLLPEKRRSICPATDLFAIGEIIFVQLFGRHSTSAERRSFVTKYVYNYDAEIFKDMNPKAFPLLDDLLCHTICGVVGKRYQSAEKLIAKLDEIIKIANPEAPYLKSSLPAVQNFFVGRENEIEEIHHKLSENRILFLNGIGGIGKSELAKHYAQEHKDDYDAIIFAPYISDVNMLLQDDNVIPLYNFAPYPEEKPEEYCARKLRKLQELCDARTLMIVDNLDREDDPDISKLLDLNCKMLITTRMDFSEYGLGQQLYLDALCNRNSILEIFRKYYTKPLTAEETACVEQIIDLVAGHTMTVELLAKQMRSGRVRPDKMLAKLQDGGISESGKEKVRSGKDGIFSAKSAYGHIQALFDLSELNRDEQFILENLTLIPYTGISVELFRDWCKLEDYEVINQLIIEGWMRFDKEKDYISLHPLLIEMVGDGIDSTSVFEKFIKSYISHLRKRGTANDTGYSEHKEDNSINIWLINAIDRNNYSAPFFSLLLNEIGGTLHAIHQYDLALRACELGAKIAIEYNTANDYHVVESLAQTALIKASIGAEQNNSSLIEEAIGIYMESIDRFQAFDQNEYPDIYEEIATLYNYLAMAYEDLNDPIKARTMYNNGIAVYMERATLEPGDYLSLGILYNNLGNTYDGSEALQYYLKAKRNHDKAGKITRHAATTLYHLADIYSTSDDNTADLSLAVDYARNVLEFFQNEYAEDLYMIGEAKYMLGKVYSQFSGSEFNQDAYMLLTQAEEIFVQFLPQEDNTITKTRDLIEKLRNRHQC